MTLIQLSDLTKVHNPGQPIEVIALRQVNLIIERGEAVALVGRSGSGKSTLLHILGCMDRPTSGTYLLDGTEIPWTDDRALAALRSQRIGFVFQDFALVPGLKAWENVALPLVHRGTTFRQARYRALEALGQVGLSDRADHYVESLSGGQRQRVAIARALINYPDIILADEPTGALDRDTGDQVMDLLFHLLRKDTTIVVATHDASLAQRCHRVLTVQDGTIVE